MSKVLRSETGDRLVFEDLLNLETHGRIAAMQREAEYYRLLVETVPLRFRKRMPVTRVRRAVARALVRLAEAIAPPADRRRCA